MPHPARSLSRVLPALATILAVAGQLSSCKDSTAPYVGSLTVTADGGPADVGASVTITGPGGFSATRTTPATLGGLRPGSYTVSALDIITAAGHWVPTQATQTVLVPASSSAAVVALSYFLSTTRLAVTIVGLATGLNAAVTVTGPNGFTRTITQSAVFDALMLGTYTITAAQVNGPQFGYRASQPTQTLTLAPSATPIEATVSYAIATGTLGVQVSGLPNVPPAGTITGPAGFSADVGSQQTFRYLTPGRYTVTASDVAVGNSTYTPAPRTQLVDVAVGAEATALVAYTGPPPALDLQLAVQGLTNPVYLSALPNDGRLFIVEQPGRIRVVKNGVLLTTPFLDIASRVSYGGERGLLSMAFDPLYASNGYFYVYLTNPNGDIAVERYGSTPGADVASPAATTVVTIPHPTYGNHNGGLVMFGPDGRLYLGTGDGGGGGDPSGNAQNLSSYLGKLLRIDVRQSLPHTLTRADIWDYGLRNPWRFDIAPRTAQAANYDLYVADVGQNAWEEIDVVGDNAGNQNFDWNRMEGSHCYPSGATTCQPTNPDLLAYEYDHSQGCSITGGFYYLGSAIPWLRNSYLFSDYCGGWLRSLKGDHQNGFTVSDWSIPAIGNVLSFGKDAAGELYMLSSNGNVYKIVPR